MSEREIFNEWIKHYEKHDVKIDQLQRAFMWQAWQASANRDGYKLVPVEPSKDVLLLMCDEVADCTDINEMYRAYKAMIGACDD